MILDAEILFRTQFGVEHGHQSKDALLFVLEGSFQCVIQNKCHLAEAGSVFTFREGTLFDRRVLQPLRCVYVRFDRFPLPLTSGLLQISDLPRLRSTVSYLASAVETGDREPIEHYLRDVLLLTQQQPPVSDRTIADCMDYLSRHYGTRIVLEQLANRYSLSKQGLIQKFRKVTGTTPMKYLSAVRITQGKALLRNTSLSIGEIADQCGFENVYYFSNAFKQACGFSPSAYRNSTVL